MTCHMFHTHILTLLYRLLLCLLVTLCIHPVPSKAQALGWEKISDVQMDKKYNEFLGFEVDIPVFSSAVQKLDGKTIVLEGFIIPTAGYKSHREFIFSAYPYNLCYFCGGAGPETVMEVEATEAIEYTAEKVTLQGTLILNATDANRLMFILKEATIQ